MTTVEAGRKALARHDQSGALTTPRSVPRYYSEFDLSPHQWESFWSPEYPPRLRPLPLRRAGWL